MSRGDDRSSPLRTIEIENGPTFQVGASEDSLLRGALRAGVAFPYECSVGGCGACRFELLEGEMDTLWDSAPGLSERDRKRGKRLACQTRPGSDCRIRVRVGASEASPAITPRRTAARLIERRAVTADMTELTFQVEGAAAFRPGQYAVFYPAGVTGARAYSMSNVDNEQGRWRFIIRRTPAGRGSAALCDALSLGQTVDLDGPYGHAYLRTTARDVVCVAGGSGLGPMLSVARGVLSDGSGRRVLFFLGLRDESELGAAAELQSLASQGRVESTVVLSSPRHAAEWTGAVGFVHAEVERQLATPMDRFDYYFAGPTPMVEAVQEMLMLRHRVPFEQIHFDRFA